MVESIEALLLITLAILPGFVAHLVYRAVLPRSVPTNHELLLLSLAFGVVNASIHLWWLLPVMLDDQEPFKEWAIAHPLRLGMGGVVYLLLSPMLVGYAPALARKHLSLPGLTNPQPTAWDHFFMRRPACVVYAVLRDGRRVAGLYNEATGGFASSYPDPQTIYCGKPFPINEDGEILGPPGESSKGIILNAEDCLILEFLDIPSIDVTSLWKARSSHEPPEEQPKQP